MSIVSEWTKNIFILILTVNFVEILTPSGSLEKYVKYVFSLIILATILSPIARILL